MTIAILNTSILTAYGTFSYSPLTLSEAREIVGGGFRSYVGHASSAAIISTLLSIDCPISREQYWQSPGDRAIVLKLKGRPQEGRILTAAEVEEIGYVWGILTRVD